MGDSVQDETGIHKEKAKNKPTHVSTLGVRFDGFKKPRFSFRSFYQLINRYVFILRLQQVLHSLPCQVAVCGDL
jgi:hypothetical protein